MPMGRRPSGVWTTNTTTLADEAETADLFQRSPPFFKRFWAWYRRKLPLMSFDDTEMERKFDHWHRNQMVSLDLIKMALSLFGTVAWVRKFRRLGGGSLSLCSTPTFKAARNSCAML